MAFHLRFSLQTGPTFQKLCDASAVAPLDADCFFAASDETSFEGKNLLKIYSFTQSEPVDTLALSAFLRGDGRMHDPAHPETDLESATRMGKRVYWIASHGRNARGKMRPDRQRFFAIEERNGAWAPVGTPYTTLLDDLTRHVPALQRAEARGLAPEEGGVSIEALCQGKDGAIWIGFRSPLLEKRALFVPLLNPSATVEGAKAILGKPWTLDLDGRGLRDAANMGDENWLLLAGPSRSRGSFALFGWNGVIASPPQSLGDIDEAALKIGLSHFQPEAILHRLDGEIYLVSDDGDRVLDGILNKSLPNQKRTFRSARVVFENC